MPTGAVRGAAETAAALRGAAEIAAALVATPLLRRRYARWGATVDEVAAPMPGDELVPRPKLGYTRAVTVEASPADVWLWLAQIGQGRGGLYSYDALENLVGCRIHSAGTILDEYRHLAPGDLIRLGPDGYPCFRVATVAPPETLVLVGADPKTHEVAPPALDRDQNAATWQWQLRPLDVGRRTRLLVRQRLTYPRSQAVLWHVLEPVTFVMERRMLLGIKARAEAGARARPAVAAS